MRRLPTCVAWEHATLTDAKRARLALPRTKFPASGLAAASVGVLGLRIVALALAFVTNIVLARTLGAEGLGVFAWATALTIVLQSFAVAGFDALAVRELSGGLATDAHGRMSGLLRHGRRAVCLVAVAVSSLAAVIGAVVSQGAQRQALFVAVLIVPIMALTTVRQAAAQGLGRVVVGRMPEDLVRPLILLAGLALAYAAGVSLTGPEALVLQNLAIAVSFVVGTLILRRVLPEQVRKANAEGSIKTWISKARSLATIGIGTVLVNQLGVLMLGVLASPREVAAFAVSTRLAVLVSLPEAALNSAFMPSIARLHATQDHARLRQRACDVAAAGGVLCLALSLPLLIAPSPILSLFGDAGEGAESVVRILCVSWVLSAFAGTNGALLMMSANTRPAVLALGSALLTLLVVTALLVPEHGSYGAAWAWFITLAVWNTLLACSVRRRLGFWVAPWRAVLREKDPEERPVT